MSRVAPQAQSFTTKNTKDTKFMEAPSLGALGVLAVLCDAFVVFAPLGVRNGR